MRVPSWVLLAVSTWGVVFLAEAGGRKDYGAAYFVALAVTAACQVALGGRLDKLLRNLAPLLLALALLLTAPLAAQQSCPPGDPACVEATEESSSAEGDAPAAPASLTDWMRQRVAAVAWCPVLTSSSEPTANAPKCSAGVAVRMTPDKLRRWAAGLFLGAKEVGPWAGYRLFSGEGGSIGIGVGYRFRMDGAIDLREGDVVAGATLSLAGARGGG